MAAGGNEDQEGHRQVYLLHMCHLDCGLLLTALHDQHPSKIIEAGYYCRLVLLPLPDAMDQKS